MDEFTWLEINLTYFGDFNGWLFFLPSAQDILDRIEAGDLDTAKKQLEILESEAEMLLMNFKFIADQHHSGRITDIDMENVRWDGKFYWIDKNDQNDGPFCQVCYDSDRKLVRLQSESDVKEFSCYRCKNDY